MVYHPLPRLAPGVLQRAGVSAWFERNADVPLRLLAAPAGSGKTSAIVLYLAASTRPAAYVALRDDETPESLRERLAEGLDIGYVPASFTALLAAIATRSPCEIAVDDIDRATPETMEELLAMSPRHRRGSASSTRRARAPYSTSDSIWRAASRRFSTTTSSRSTPTT
jgi:ATP/maltotriose-dependent transcriptional regulator MalT